MKILEVQTDEEVMLSTLEPGDVFVILDRKISCMKVACESLLAPMHAGLQLQWAVCVDDGVLVGLQDQSVRVYLDAAILLEPASVGL